MTKVAIYLRVSTHHQSIESQLTAIEAYCMQNSITEYEIFTDEGISGSKANRPALDALMAKVRQGNTNTVIVYSFSRFARSTKHLLTALDEFQLLGVNFISISEKLDTGSAIGKAIFTIIASIAELEKHLIKERVIAGLNNARKNGKRLGAPTKHINKELLSNLQKQNLTYKEMGKLLNLSPATVWREVKSFRKSNA